MEISSKPIQPFSDQLQNQMKKTTDLSVYTESLKKNEEVPMTNEEIVDKYSKMPIVILSEETKNSLNYFHKQNSLQQAAKAYSADMIGA